MSGLVRVFWLGRAFLPHARIASAACGGWSAELCSALTRRYVGMDDGFVNCGPAKGCVWPVLAPAKGLCARGSVCAARRLSRGAVFVLCRSCVIGMSCARSRPSYVPAEMFYARSRLLFAACAPNRTACGMFRSCSAVGRDRHSCVLESSVRLSGFVGSLRACTFLYGDPDGERRDGGTRRTEGTENGVGGGAECVFA